MRWDKKSALVEQKVYEALEDLEEEFNIDLPSYPEVRWIGRSGQIEGLNLAENEQSSIRKRINAQQSFYLPEHNVIVIGSNDSRDFHEEAAHCFHLNIAKINFRNKIKLDRFALCALVEMFGFFGSKILDPSTKNVFHNLPDYGNFSKEKIAKLYEDNKREGYGLDNIRDIMIHAQGYGLGDRLFYSYISGKIRKSEIRELLKRNFSKDGSAALSYAELREELWPLNKK